MKPQEISVYGLTGQYPVPESVDEYDKNGKVVGACLKNAIRYTVYHVSLTDVRDAFINGLDEVKDGPNPHPKMVGIEEGLGIDMKMKKVKKGNSDEEIEVPDEKDEQFVNRVRAELIKTGKAKDETAANALMQPYLDSAIKYCPFDASVNERKPGAGLKLAKMYVEQATAVLNGTASPAFGNKVVSLPKLVAAIKKDIGQEFVKSGDAAKDIQVLGRQLKDWYAFKDAQAAAQRMSALA